MNNFIVYQEWIEDENGEWLSNGWVNAAEEPLDLYEYDITDVEYNEQGLAVEGMARKKNTYV